jgi:hypothetical protein
MKRIFSLLSAALLLGLISFPLFAQPVSERELESLVQQRQQALTPKADTASDPSYAELVAYIRQLEAELIRLSERTEQLARAISVAGTTPAPVPAPVAPAPVTPPPEPSIGEAQGAFPLAGVLAGETSLGDAIADVSAYYFRIASLYQQHVDFAFHNGGLLKAGLDSGPITEEEILAILPEDTYLVYGSVLGADILELSRKVPSIPQDNPLFMQVSDDVKYTIDYTSGTLNNLTIGGAPVDPTRYYAFVTNADLFNIAPAEIQKLALNVQYTTFTLTDVLFDAVWFIGEQGWSLFPYTDGRISVIGGK